MLQRIEQRAVMLIVVCACAWQRLADDDGSRLGCLGLGGAAAVPVREASTATAARCFHEHGVFLSAGDSPPGTWGRAGQKGA